MTELKIPKGWRIAQPDEYKEEGILFASSDCPEFAPRGRLFEGHPFENQGYYIIRDDTSQPSDTQVGGDHYTRFAIQPGEFVTKNRLEGFATCIVKRLCAFRVTRDIEELEKMAHEAQLYLQWEKERWEAENE